MKVVIAPDKFKGSLTAAQVAAHVAAGLRSFLGPDLEVEQIPMADGGEGTVDAALAAGYTERVAQVRGPLGEPRQARYAFAPDTPEGPTAVLEMALASGLAFTKADPDAARRSSSIGTGDLIVDALDAGATRIVLGVGGSASTDGGAGLLVALGLRLLDADGAELPGGGDALRHLASVDVSGLDPRVAGVSFVLAADVDNPLLGATGAAEVYGRQKGADDAALADLEAGLTRWVQALEAAVPGAAQAADEPGAGAAGGVGYAAIALLHATRRPGVEEILELTGFHERAVGATLVITGEGSLDGQSLYGKTPVGVAAAARQVGAPTIAVAGRTTLTEQELAAHGIVARYVLTDLSDDVETCMREAGPMLERLAAELATEHLAGSAQEEDS